MAEARVRDQWARTSSVMALIANTHRDPRKGKPFKPSDFAPGSAGSGNDGENQAPPRVGVEVLRQVFLPRNHPRNPDKEPLR